MRSSVWMAAFMLPLACIFSMVILLIGRTACFPRVQPQHIIGVERYGHAESLFVMYSQTVQEDRRID